MICSTRLVVAAVLCLATFLAGVQAAGVGPELLLTEATLLSGGLESCPQYNATACVGGLAAAAARRRVIAAAGIRHVFLNAVDRSSVFVKLHPLDWGVNYNVMRRFNMSTMVARVTFVTPLVKVAFQDHPDRASMLDNVNFPPGHLLRAYTDTVVLDRTTGVQLVSVRAAYRGLATAATVAADVLTATSRFNDGSVKHTVLVTHDVTPAALLAAVRAITTHRPTAVINLFAARDTPTLVNGTYLLNAGASGSLLTRIRLHENAAGQCTDLTVLDESLTLEPALRDSAEHIADQQFLRAEAVSAATNNPVVGQTDLMPAVPAAGEQRPCIQRECSMGNLWADAVRGRAATDISFFPGPWVQGPGWAAGNVTLLDLYGSFAFSNELCRGTALGLTIFELLNETIDANSFNPNGDPNANVPDSMMAQVSGMKITFDRARASNRLVSIEVWNATTNAFEPLQRLKLYTVSGISFMCTAWRPYSTYLTARYEGEVAAKVLTETNLHSEVGAYIGAQSPRYAPGTSGRLTNQAGAAGNMQSWLQLPGGCAANEEYAAALKSCLPCKAGYQNPGRADACTLIPAASSSGLSTMVLLVIVVVAFVVLVVAALVGAKLWSMHRRARRVRFCPKSSTEPFAAFYATVANEVAMRERHEDAADAVLTQVEQLVSRIADENGCFVARRLEAHFLLVTPDPAAAVRCASVLHKAFYALDWTGVLQREELQGAQRQSLRHSTLHEAGQSSSYVANHRQSSVHKKSVAGRSGSRVRRGQSHSEGHAGQSHSEGHAGRSQRQSSPGASHNHHSSLHMSTMSGSSRPGSDPGSPVTQASGVTRGSHTKRGRVLPELSVGVSFGYGRVTYDDTTELYSYAGGVLDHAAAVTDVTRPGQVLATEGVVEKVKGAGAAGAEFEEFCMREGKDPLKRKTREVLLHQVNPAGCPHRSFDPPGESGDDAVAGALTAALETAAGGLTTRRVVAVAVVVPQLRCSSAFESRGDHAAACEAVLLAVQAAAAPHDLVSAVDGCFVIFVNGSQVRTAQAPLAAAVIAKTAHMNVEEAGFDAFVGLAMGPAVAGAAGGLVTVNGVNAQRATLLANIAAEHRGGPAVITSGDLRRDLDPHFVTAAFDIVAWPVRCIAHHAPLHEPTHSTSRRASRRASETKASGGTATPQAGPSPQMLKQAAPFVVFALEDEKASGEDDEWLYQLDNALRDNPHSEVNAAFDAVIASCTVDNGAKSTEVVAFSPVSEGAASPSAPAGGPSPMPADKLGDHTVTTAERTLVNAEAAAYGSGLVLDQVERCLGTAAPRTQERASLLRVFAEHRVIELALRFLPGPKPAMSPNSASVIGFPDLRAKSVTAVEDTF